MGRAAGLLLVLAAFLGACGQVTQEPDAAARRGPQAAGAQEPAEDPPADDEYESGSSGGLLYAEIGQLGRSGERPELNEVYAAFARPRNDRDARASSFAADWFNEPEDTHDMLGRPRASEARLLLEGLGGERDMVYAVPTDKAYVCIGLAPDGGSSCGGPGPNGFDLGWSDDGKALVVYGMVGNDVRGVDVIIAGRPRPARMGENAYAIRLEETKSEQLAGVVLHYRDRPSETIELP